MKTTFNSKQIKYIRITSIDQIDFENLDPEYLHQLAKAYANLSRSLPVDCEDDQD